MNTYNQLIHKYNKNVAEKGLSLEISKAFLFELCNEYNVNLYLEMDNEALEIIDKKFNEGMRRILNYEPLNYVLGYSYFYGYKFIVNKNVLIPRPETEELVCLILKKYDEYFNGKKIKACDIGTGSGAIAISLKKEETNFELFASDISDNALEVAKLNAKNNNVDIKFFSGSMLDPYVNNNIKVDIIISNPPYIKTNEKLDSSVINYEPHIALFGGGDGLKFYRLIFESAKKVLNDNGMLFFEMGYDQKDSLSKLASDYFPNSLIEVYKDINNKDRMLFIKI